MSLKRYAPIALALATVTGAQALDPTLRLGAIDLEAVFSGEVQDPPPYELTTEVDFMSRQNDEGKIRHDAGVIHAEASGRLYGAGITLDMWMAAEDGEPTFKLPSVADPATEFLANEVFGIGNDEISAGEITEIRLKIDYLIEIPDIVQIIPHYQTSWYPATGGNARPKNASYWYDVLNPFQEEKWGAEPHWIGADTWFMLPWEGMEFGGSYDWDMNEKAGWKGALGFRQFIQIANLDLAAYQIARFGDDDYHNFLIGVKREGLTILDVGLRATLPLPWEGWYFYGGGEWQWWVDSKDRGALDDPSTWSISTGIQFRL